MYYICLFTDANRGEIKVNITTDMNALLQQKRSNRLFFAGSGADKLIFIEEFSTELNARIRFGELSTWTRAQKERLIRNSNPNWINISTNNHLFRETRQLMYA